MSIPPLIVEKSGDEEEGDGEGESNGTSASDDGGVDGRPF
jgi:hypothetical protein